MRSLKTAWVRPRLAAAAALLIAVLGLLVIAGTAGAAVFTDKDDYLPGETVTISGDNSNGAGYLAGETIHVEVSGPNGFAASCQGIADDAGAWSCQVTLPSDDSAVGDYSYTASGGSSGVSESGMFTDKPPEPDDECNGGPLNPCHVKQSSLDEHQGECTGSGGRVIAWHFVITSITTPPATILVTWGPPESDSHTVELSKFVGGVAHYDAPPPTIAAGSLVTDAVADVSGNTGNIQFNLSTVTCEGGGEPKGELTACKYEDLNANGARDAGESPLSGWEMTISPLDGAPEPQTQTTGSSGCVTWTNLIPGEYTVTEAPPAGGTPWWNTDPGPLCLIIPSGCPAPSKTITVVASTTSEVWFGNIQSAEKHGQKFYDRDADGIKDPGEVGVCGYKITLTGIDVAGNPVGPTTVYTNASGNYSFIELLPGSYRVTETAPNASWFNTTPTFLDFVLVPGEIETDNDFGNVCLVPTGGLTLGFWSNKNGYSVMNDSGSVDPELALLSGLNLRKANGDPFDPANYNQFRTWLLNADAFNMAYMLSAQLAAMTLNVEAGFVSGSTMLYAPSLLPFAPIPGLSPLGFISVNDLMAAANAELGLHGVAIGGGEGSAFRPYQQALKNVLDAANKNSSIAVSPTPCPFTSPY